MAFKTKLKQFSKYAAKIPTNLKQFLVNKNQKKNRKIICNFFKPLTIQMCRRALHKMQILKLSYLKVDFIVRIFYIILFMHSQNNFLVLVVFLEISFFV